MEHDRYHTVNHAFLLGSVGRTVTDKITASGARKVEFKLGTEYTRHDGETRTDWTHSACFGAMAELAVELARPGARLLVQGRIATSGIDVDGVRVRATQIVAFALSEAD